MGNLIIRPGAVADMEAVYRLVCELAEFEKEPHQVVTSPEIYRKDFADGWFDFLVAEIDDEVVGIALGHPAYSTWKGRMYYLDDLVIQESFRGRGIGGQLFLAFIELARNKGANLLKWQVLDWNEEAITFYQKHNSIIESDWLNGKLYL